MKKISFSAFLICFTFLINTNLVAAQVNTPSPSQNAQEAKNKYPVVDYDAPEPDNAKEREERRKKNKRYDTHGPVVSKNIHPQTGQVNSSDAEPIPPPIPSAESSLIIIGEILNSKASLANNKKGVYSEFTVRIQTILKEDNQKGIKHGENITIDSAGGYVRYPNGQQVLYLIDWHDFPKVTGRYVFFLNNQDQSPNYSIIIGYEIVNGSVTALDNMLYARKFNGMSEADFINLILNKVKTPLN